MKKILSIDGGGMYGVIPAEVCIAIEDKLQQRLKQTFDLFVRKRWQNYAYQINQSNSKI